MQKCPFDKGLSKRQIYDTAAADVAGGKALPVAVYGFGNRFFTPAYLHSQAAKNAKSISCKRTYEYKKN